VKDIYFEPWIGRNYKSTRTLILSESAYSWRDENGAITQPGRQHPTGVIRHWAIEHFGAGNRYHTLMTRALCQEKTPSRTKRSRAWHRYAHSIYVQSSVGFGERRQPTPRQFEAARDTFLQLLRSVRPVPLKVVVTGKTMWNRMPQFDGPHLCDDFQAYRLPDGGLVWCLAVPHPSNREKAEGFVWERVGRAIRVFERARLPSGE
jgi:hypothetical protein